MILITRNEAIEIAGQELVTKAENENAEATSQQTDGTNWHGYDIYKSTMDNDTHRVEVIFLQNTEETLDIPLDDMQWDIEGYIVEDI